jgi:hypothetical protein
VGEGGEITQTLYAHMNKRNKRKYSSVWVKQSHLSSLFEENVSFEGR